MLDQQEYNDVLINGPAVGYQFTYLSAFAEASKSGNVVKDATYHQYYGDGPSFTVPDFYSLSVLDSLIAYLEDGKAAAQDLTSFVAKSAAMLIDRSSVLSGRARHCGLARPRQRTMAAHRAHHSRTWLGFCGWTSWAWRRTMASQPCVDKTSTAPTTVCSCLPTSRCPTTGPACSSSSLPDPRFCRYR